MDELYGMKIEQTLSFYLHHNNELLKSISKTKVWTIRRCHVT